MRGMWIVTLLFAFGAGAAELTVMSTGAVKAPFTEASAQWSRDTGHKVSATFDPAGPLRQKIASGMRGDIVIIPIESFAALEKDGVIVAGSRRDLGAVSMGAAVKEGAPVPDISSVEALKSTLRNAKSVTYMDPERGTSGKHFDATVLPRLGMRDEVRAMTETFVEIHVATSLEECEARDVKGLYAKAFSGEIKEFTGVSDPYEAPENPDVHMQTKGQSPEKNATQIVTTLKTHNLTNNTITT